MVKNKKRDISGDGQSEDRLAKLNRCLLSFGADSSENINLLVKLCGEELGGACALYNRLCNGMLHAAGQWSTPPDYLSVC